MERTHSHMKEPSSARAPPRVGSTTTHARPGRHGLCVKDVVCVRVCGTSSFSLPADLNFGSVQASEHRAVLMGAVRSVAFLRPRAGVETRCCGSHRGSSNTRAFGVRMSSLSVHIPVKLSRSLATLHASLSGRIAALHPGVMSRFTAWFSVAHLAASHGRSPSQRRPYSLPSSAPAGLACPSSLQMRAAHVGWCRGLGLMVSCGMCFARRTRAMGLRMVPWVARTKARARKHAAIYVHTLV